jgi:ADP-ribose pyrophosphatase YjhB (NUDIX family)
MQSLWRLISSQRKFSDRLIAVDHDRYELSGNGKAGEFTIIRTTDWINVIPFTREGKLVFIRQFRHGIREVTLEIPGGAIDARDETPRMAAERELREETGYEALNWEYLGYVTPNPALQNNRCHTFLATEAHRGGTSFARGRRAGIAGSYGAPRAGSRGVRTVFRGGIRSPVIHGAWRRTACDMYVFIIMANKMKTPGPCSIEKSIVDEFCGKINS